MDIADTLRDISYESQLNEAEKVSLRLIAGKVNKLCAENKKLERENKKLQKIIDKEKQNG